VCVSASEKLIAFLGSAKGGTIELILGGSSSLEVPQQASTSGGMLCKVYPSPGAARSVWGLQGHSCNMEQHSGAARDDKDALCCNHVHMDRQNCKSIFDLVRTG
jgi:hypothetical protein